jgi:hemolysin activation/secretion protein
MRDLEQGLEQMKRVASQDVDMKIEPTDTSRESDVVRVSSTCEALDVRRIGR